MLSGLRDRRPRGIGRSHCSPANGTDGPGKDRKRPVPPQVCVFRCTIPKKSASPLISIPLLSWKPSLACQGRTSLAPPHDERGRTAFAACVGYVDAPVPKTLLCVMHILYGAVGGRQWESLLPPTLRQAGIICGRVSFRRTIRRMGFFQLHYPLDQTVLCDHKNCESIADYLEVDDHGQEFRVCASHTESTTHASRLPTRKPNSELPFRSRPGT